MVKFCPHRDFCFDTGHIILLAIAVLGIYCYYTATKGAEKNTLETITHLLHHQSEKIDDLERSRNRASDVCT